MNRFFRHIPRILAHVMSFLLLLWWQMGQVVAQCSQCKAAAASEGVEGEVAIFNSINAGVVYLLVLPIVMPMIVGAIWWWRSRQFGRLAQETD
jgi:hypothetical protein